MSEKRIPTRAKQKLRNEIEEEWLNYKDPSKKTQVQTLFEKYEEKRLKYLQKGAFALHSTGEKCILLYDDQYNQQNEEYINIANEYYSYLFSTERGKNKSVALEAILQDSNAFQYLTSELKNDKEVILLAVAQNGNAIEYASDELKNDREIVLAAVKQYGGNLQYASETVYF